MPGRPTRPRYSSVNGDVAVIGRDLTTVYGTRLPQGVYLAPDERLVVIPGNMLSAAKKDIPDA